MIERILVAVNDSPPALAAVAVATELAAAQRARIRFVAVADDAQDVSDLLAHVTRIAHASHLEPETTVIDGGHPFEVLLEVAAEWPADLIVMGRSDRRRPGTPYVGTQTEHLLEFTLLPVLVVPEPSARIVGPGRPEA